jgi:carotenoid cleavage dioxygenase-like enzyme
MRLAATIALCLLVCGVLIAEDLPPGVEQIIPRGAIAAVLDPEFVPAAEADISADAWILGVALDGEARAYSLNLLNHHEVVNDRVGDLPIAAVW